jgi:hypothetical protein
MEKLKIYEELQKFLIVQERQMRSDVVYRKLHSTFVQKMANKNKVLALISTDGTCFYQGSISSIMDAFIASGKALSPSSICLDFPKVFRSLRKKSGNKKRRIQEEIEFA